MNSKRGIGYAHSAPLALRLRQGQLLRPEKLAERWDTRWKPDATLAAKRTSDPPVEFLRLHALWHERMRRVLAAGITWSSILRSNYDSPFSTPADFDRNLASAVLRHTCEVGKRKGVKHPRRPIVPSQRLINSKARKLAREQEKMNDDVR